MAFRINLVTGVQVVCALSIKEIYSHKKIIKKNSKIQKKLIFTEMSIYRNIGLMLGRRGGVRCGKSKKIKGNL